MATDPTTFNPQELCSRKLWQLVNTPTEASISKRDLDDVISELASRRHYLAELEKIGKLAQMN